jgi:copper chaperone CopZ
MKAEVLYFDGCPHHRPTVERVKEVLEEEGVPTELSEVNVPDEAAAQAAGFLGSPTVRIAGLDIEPQARASRSYGIMCRTYAEGGRREGLPSKDLIRAAIREALRPADSREPRRPGFLIAGSVIAAALASFCCILPIVFALTGLSVLGASAWFAAWRPYLLLATFGFLGLGFYYAYRPLREPCEPGAPCAVPRTRRGIRIVLWLTTAAVLALAAFPYYSGPVAELLLSDGPAAAAPAKPVQPALAKASLKIEGMDCSACATAVENKLKAVHGVRDAKVSYEKGVAEIQYQPGTASPAELERAVQEAGYKVRKTT